MPRLILISFCCLLAAPAHAQTRTVAPDSIIGEQISILDSVNSQVTKSFATLKYDYDSIENKYNSLISGLQTKADSLDRIDLPFHTLLQKRDSINSLKEAKLSAINKKVETLKSNTIDRINELDFPPELKSKVDEYIGVINKLDLSLPTSAIQLPTLKFHNNLNLAVPDLNIPLQRDLPNLPAANIPGTDKISKATSQFEGLSQYVPKELPTMDQVDKTAETQVGKIGEISAIQDQIGNLPTAPITSKEQTKQELLKVAKEAATDHFAGKEQELKSAMDQFSKYKKKFHNVNNLEELAKLIKKRPNEMKGKPLIERIVPGIAFQIQKEDDLLFVDFNPYVGYRFTGKLTAGIGWNQRVAYNLNDNLFDSEPRIFGPRTYGEYKLWRGFSPRIEIETMNTFVPPYIKVSPADLGQREWVWGVFAGIKKDYKFFKKINGTALIMFRLFDPHRKSPYADVVNARFGFQFPMKKKSNAVSKN